ncbi:MAG: hypothetical protein AAFX39_12430, partial [Pseudomonadota bacterium]
MFSVLNNIGIAIKMPAIVVVSATVIAVSIGFIGYQQSAGAVKQSYEDRLTALATGRSAELSNYFQAIREDLETLSASPFAREA